MLPLGELLSMRDGVVVPEAVLCVPGPWAERSDLTKSLVQSTSGHIFAGMLLMDMETRVSCELQLEGRDERMLAAFKAAGPHWSQTEEMMRIGEHRSVIYLVGHGGSQTNFAPLMHAARALLDAGGFGVKVESAGLAHQPNEWRRLCNELYLFSAHEACVVYVSAADVCSCGMHNLGLKDAVVATGDAEDAVELLRTFTRYVFAEQAEIRPGQTFSVASDAPVYRVVDDAGPRYEDSSLFNNPYGFWRLVPATETGRVSKRRTWWRLR